MKFLLKFFDTYQFLMITGQQYWIFYLYIHTGLCASSRTVH